MVWYLKQIAKVKKLSKWVYCEQTANQKSHPFGESSSLILHNNNKPFLNWIVMCNEKWILYDNQLSGWTKKLQSTFQSHTCTKKKKKKKNHGHLLVVCCLSDPLQFSESIKTITSESMCSKLMKCAENCNTCSWHWSTERAWFFSVTRPGHTSQNQRCKGWMNWATKFCLICHIYLTSHQLSTISSRILTTFW